MPQWPQRPFCWLLAKEESLCQATLPTSTLHLVLKTNPAGGSFSITVCSDSSPTFLGWASLTDTGVSERNFLGISFFFFLRERESMSGFNFIAGCSLLRVAVWISCQPHVGSTSRRLKIHLTFKALLFSLSTVHERQIDSDRIAVSLNYCLPILCTFPPSFFFTC